MALPFTTPRKTWALPREGQDPWLEPVTDLWESIDSSVFATQETNSYIFTEGGTVTFTNGVLTWTSDIVVKAPTTGFLLKIPQPGSGLTLQDGDFFYVNTVRAPLSDQTLTALAAQTVPNTDAVVVIGMRKGSKFHTINGRVIDLGQSFALFNSSSASTGGSSSSGQSVFARMTNVAVGPQGPDAYDVGVAEASTSRVTICARTDKAVTAGTLTIRIGNQTGPIFSTTLTSATNGGLFVTTVNQVVAFTIGDLITLEIQTDGTYTHSTGGLAAVKVSAVLFS